MGFPQFTTRLDSRNGVDSLAWLASSTWQPFRCRKSTWRSSRAMGSRQSCSTCAASPSSTATALQAFLAARDRANENGHRLVLG